MKKSTILIVDDVAENLIVMGEILSQYNIKIAKDGEKALSIVKESRDISLIILDIMMPGIDGFETCRRLKKDPSTFDIPVIFMTSLSDTEDIVKGFELGAVDYVTKPIKGKELLARVNTHLTLSLLQREMKLINKLLEAKVVERTAELQAAKEKAEESSKLKSHFLSLMSHEFRTPLNGILGYAELLMLELTNEEWKEFAEGIYNSGRRLTETLNSILNLARFESDQKEIIPASFNVIDRLNQLLQSYHLMAKQKDVTLKVNSNIAEIDFKTDKTIFDICINSLLSNAVKYTKKVER